jgi:kinase
VEAIKLTTFQPINDNVEDILYGLTDNNLVGSGGSGKVYKICLGNNCKIVDKKIGNCLKKDDMLENSIKMKLGLLDPSGMLTFNLLGFISASELKLLVYEYMEHGSLSM